MTGYDFEGGSIFPKKKNDVEITLKQFSLRKTEGENEIIFFLPCKGVLTKSQKYLSCF